MRNDWQSKHQAGIVMDAFQSMWQAARARGASLAEAKRDANAAAERARSRYTGRAEVV